MLLLITWALLGLLLGTASFVVVPWVLAFLGGVEMRDKVGRYYVKQLMTVLGNAALVAREQGGVTLKPVTFDSTFSADRVTVGGDTGHLADDLNLKSRLAGAAFGIGLESHPAYVSPLFAEFAEYASKAKHNDRVGVRADGGVRLDFEIPDVATVPPLRGAHRMLDGDAHRRFGTLSESWAKKSQEKFGKRVSLGQTMLLMAAFGVGSAVGFAAIKYAPEGGSSGVEVPIQIMPMLVGVAV